MEVGGRWNETALAFLALLAKYKVQEASPVLRRSAQLAWINRWSAMRSISVQDAFAASVLAPACKGLVLDESTSDAPPLDVLLDCHREAV